MLGNIAGWSWRILVSAAALVLIAFVLVQLDFVIVPLLLALLVSSVLAPLTNWLVGRGLARGVAATLTVIAALGVIGVFLAIALPPLIRSGNTLVGAFDFSADHLYDWLETGPLNLPHDQIAELESRVNELVPQIKSLLIEGLQSAVPVVFQIFTTFVLMVVLTAYLLAGGDRYWQWVLGFFNPVNRPGINELGRSAYSTLASYLQGTAIMAAIYGGGVGIFAFLLGVKLAAILALVVFALAFLPIIGAWTSGALVAALSYLSGGFWTMAAMVGILLLLSQINSLFLRPQIVGDRVSLVPLVTFTTVLAGTAVAGVIGGILAVPLVAVVSGALGTVRRWRSEGGVPTADPIADKRLDPDAPPA